jgi:type I restriction enzyme S subunit
MSSERLLSDIAEIVMGQSPTGETCNEQGNGIPLLNGPTEFGDKHPRPVQFTTDAKKLALVGDLLFCVRGSTTGRMNWADQQYAIGRGLAAIRGKDGYPNSFVRAVIETNLESLLVQATGSTFPNVSRDLISALPVPGLGQDAAKVIASIVEPIDDRITLLRETNTTLEAIAQALFKSWFVDFNPVHAKMQGRAPEGMDEATAALFPDSFEESELGAVPKGWSLGLLSDLMQLHKGSINPLNHPEVLFSHFSLPAFDGGQMPVLEVGYEIKSNKTTVPLDAVLVSKLNPHIPRIWLPSALDSNAVCSTEFLPFVPTSRTTTNFVYALLIEPSFMNAMTQLVTGTSNSHQRIKPDSVLSLKHVVPEKKTIKAFDGIVSPLMDRMKATRQQIGSLASLRNTLLPRLISGQLRLPESQALLVSLE